MTKFTIHATQIDSVNASRFADGTVWFGYVMQPMNRDKSAESEPMEARDKPDFMAKLRSFTDGLKERGGGWAITIHKDRETRAFPGFNQLTGGTYYFNTAELKRVALENAKQLAA